MKKIVVLYPAHYEQSMGGAEMQIKYFIRACRQEGHEVHYIYEDKGNVIKNEEGIILHPMSRISKMKFCGKGWFLYKNGINKFLNEIKPDVMIFTHNHLDHYDPETVEKFITNKTKILVQKK